MFQEGEADPSSGPPATDTTCDFSLQLLARGPGQGQGCVL